MSRNDLRKSEEIVSGGNIRWDISASQFSCVIPRTLDGDNVQPFFRTPVALF